MTVRPDRLSSYRQKLRRSLDTFEFGALIEGVSTLEEEAQSGAEPIKIGLYPSAVAAIETAPPKRVEPDEPVEPADTLQTVLQLPQADAHLQKAGQPINQQRLRLALCELSSRLRHELGSFQALLDQSEIEEAGVHLARIN